MAGADRMYDALFRQVGVIRAQTFSDLIDIPAALEREIRDAVAHVARHGWCAASWQPEVVAMSTPLRLGHHPRLTRPVRYRTPAPDSGCPSGPARA